MALYLSSVSNSFVTQALISKIYSLGGHFMNRQLAIFSLFRISLLLTCVLSLSASGQNNAIQPIHNVVLVHGAWADGSSWSKVVPLLEEKGLHVVCVQNPLTSFADDVAATKRIIDAQDGPVLLVGHSYGGAVITEAGNDPKVVGLVYVAAFAPDKGESSGSLGKPYGATPGSLNYGRSPMAFSFLPQRA
jgi:pimeloyl-ACP methyl ester carboxylesterase